MELWSYWLVLLLPSGLTCVSAVSFDLLSSTVSGTDWLLAQEFPCSAWWAGILESLKSGNGEPPDTQRDEWEEREKQ